MYREDVSERISSYLSRHVDVLSHKRHLVFLKLSFSVYIDVVI